jgi:PAS domain-containing protein
VAQKHLILILARELASNLATPTLICDAEGTMIFFNEAAEEIVGGPFADIGEIPMAEFSAGFEPRTRNHKPLSEERRPTRIALEERRAAHEQLVVTSRDGVERQVAITAFPLFAHADEFVGMIAIFWRE